MYLKTWRVLLYALIAILFFQASARAEAVLGQPAPSFVATSRDGKAFDLAALKGKVVIITFWATWSPPCRDELPALEAVWRKYRGQGLEILAVSADTRRMKADVNQAMRVFTFPVAMLDAVAKNDVVTLTSVPITYVVDKGGKVANVLTPETQPLTEEGLGAEVKALLEAKEETKADAKPEEKK